MWIKWKVAERKTEQEEAKMDMPLITESGFENFEIEPQLKEYLYFLRGISGCMQATSVQKEKENRNSGECRGATQRENSGGVIFQEEPNNIEKEKNRRCTKKYAC